MLPASQPATEPVFKNPQGVKPSDYELATEIEYLFTAEDDSGFAGLLPFVLFMVDECELPPPLQIGVHDLVAVPVIRSLLPISYSRHPLRSCNHRRTRSTLWWWWVGVPCEQIIISSSSFICFGNPLRRRSFIVYCWSPLGSHPSAAPLYPRDPKQSSVNKLISLRSLNCDHGCNDRRSGGIKFNSTGRYVHCFL